MSYDPRGRPYGAPGMSETDEDGDARKGSVRAARQRLQAAQLRTQLPDTSKIIGLPQRPNQLVSQYSTQPRAEQNRPPPVKTGRTENTDTSPQWPLPGNATAVRSSPALPPRSPKRLQPPQDYMPTLEDYPLPPRSPKRLQPPQDYSNDFPVPQLSPMYAQPASARNLQPTSPGYDQSYPSDEVLSPTSHRSSRPITTSSVLSETSSLGSIPDFPVPQPPMPAMNPANSARRMPSLGPPPSARRGPSSYYTQMSYVSPIAEESDRSDTVRQSLHGSFASSNVFPTHRDFYPNDDLMSDDDSTITSERGNISPYEQDDGMRLVQQSPALVRQASLGRRTKPSLMTIKSVDSFGDKKNNGKNKAALGAMGVGGTGLASSSLAHGNPGAGRGIPSSASNESLSSLRRMQELTAATFGPDELLSQETRPATLAERAGTRRPPKLNMDAVRDAEARGSLTSLPELIRRATQLAANLDRGKTASRLGLDFWENGAPGRKEGRQSGLSDMLAAFPPPGQDTPGRGGTPNAAHNRNSKWPSGSGFGASDSRVDNEKRQGRRRCCGMPMWTFVTLLIVLLFVIAAAAVIPVVLVVIPNQNKANNSAAQNGQGNGNNGGASNTRPAVPAPTLAPGSSQCDGVITCQNGGISILNADRTCNCVCINGFTGSTCTNNDATGCTTANIAGAANNATVGTAISRLLGDSADGFNIPLNSTRVLSLFSELSLSCPAQNALITFNGLASRSERYLRSLDVALEPSKSLPVLHNPHPAELKRQAVGESGRPAETSRVAQPSASSTPTLPVSSNTQALDFARVGVLFALQQSGDLDTAAKGQEAIQSFLASNRNGNAASNSINMGPFKMDLVQLSITLNNGTVIRASPSSSSTS